MPSTIVTTDATLATTAALDGLGLAYVDELTAGPHIASGKLVAVLEDYLPREPGFFLDLPERSRGLPKLRALIDLLRVRG